MILWLFAGNRLKIREDLSTYRHFKRTLIMGLYKFDWQDVVHGQIEIEAESGVKAEQILHEMKLQERLNLSQVGVDNDTLKIKFVDLGFDDLLVSCSLRQPTARSGTSNASETTSSIISAASCAWSRRSFIHSRRLPS